MLHQVNEMNIILVREIKRTRQAPAVEWVISTEVKLKWLNKGLKDDSSLRSSFAGWRVDHFPRFKKDWEADWHGGSRWHKVENPRMTCLAVTDASRLMNTSTLDDWTSEPHMNYFEFGFFFLHMWWMVSSAYRLPWFGLFRNNSGRKWLKSHDDCHLANNELHQVFTVSSCTVQVLTEANSFWRFEPCNLEPWKLGAVHSLQDGSHRDFLVTYVLSYIEKLPRESSHTLSQMLEMSIVCV
jgi:hypothetical protein